jgi:hypothetical protein
MQFLSKVDRTPKGRRIFTNLHKQQIAILRYIFTGEWPGKNIRRASLHFIQSLPSRKRPELLEKLQLYKDVIREEIEKAESAVQLLKKYNQGTIVTVTIRSAENPLSSSRIR